jgi:prepilin-type N-terminal cleavage/methylation domain-containing protein
MRKGMTLIEVLVVIAIIGIVMALSLAAIARTRMVAIRFQSMNQMRQINLAFHAYSESRGELPSILNVMVPDGRDCSPFFAIWPLLDYNSRIFVSPADPSLAFVNPANRTQEPVEPDAGYSSYAYNALVFTGQARINRIPDGLSNTISLGEHYARCAKREWAVFIFSLMHSYGDGGSRRPSFADLRYGDVVPITTAGNPRITAPSVSGVTFQARPALLESDATLLQTPHAEGMLTGMMDGSIRTIGPGVTPNVFWGAVTPNGEEVHQVF